MFAAGRAFEIIRNSIGYTHANVKICATHAGITVGEDGASHQTFEDLALMRTIPGMTVLNPSDGVSAAALIKQAVAFDGPAYIRLGRAAVPTFYTEEMAAKLEIGKAVCLRTGDKKDGKPADATIIATGIMVNEAMLAAAELAADGIEVRVIDMHTIKPLDADIIYRAARETGAIVTAEEHSILGGLGTAVAETLAKNRVCVPLETVGIRDCFTESGAYEDLVGSSKSTWIRSSRLPGTRFRKREGEGSRWIKRSENFIKSAMSCAKKRWRWSTTPRPGILRRAFRWRRWSPPCISTS